MVHAHALACLIAFNCWIRYPSRLNIDTACPVYLSSRSTFNLTRSPVLSVQLALLHQRPPEGSKQCINLAVSHWSLPALALVSTCGFRTLQVGAMADCPASFVTLTLRRPIQNYTLSIVSQDSPTLMPLCTVIAYMATCTCTDAWCSTQTLVSLCSLTQARVRHTGV